MIGGECVQKNSPSGHDNWCGFLVLLDQSSSPADSDSKNNNR